MSSVIMWGHNIVVSFVDLFDRFVGISSGRESHREDSCIFTMPSIPREYLSFFGGLACLCVMVRLSISKSYWVTSEMESEVSNLSTSSSYPISFSLE